MEKVALTKYKGIEYIRIGELPKNQSEQIVEWLSKDQVIKILTEEKLMDDCVQYADYSYWFDHVYKPEVKKVAVKGDYRSKKKWGFAFD